MTTDEQNGLESSLYDDITAIKERIFDFVYQIDIKCIRCNKIVLEGISTNPNFRYDNIKHDCEVLKQLKTKLEGKLGNV